VLITDVLAATTNSDATFLVPILVRAAALGVGWVLVFVAVAAWRRPRGIRAGPATQDLPPVPPAVAGHRRPDDGVEGYRVAGMCTVNLGYVRELRPPSAAPST
jgi:hypothetical protein